MFPDGINLETAAVAPRWYQVHNISTAAILPASMRDACCHRRVLSLAIVCRFELNPELLNSKGLEQYITGHAGKGKKWRDVNKTLLHLPPVARPARRICGLHAV